MNSHVDNTGIRLGMWLFLYTELMLFGGLFILYAAYYYRFTGEFIAAGKELELLFGTMNTVILLTSSFTVVCAIEAIRRNSRNLSMFLYSVTVILGALFLFNKYIEWSHKFAHGIYPGSEILAGSGNGKVIFFGLYFTLTGLHALHVIIGISVLSVCLFFVKTGRASSDKMNVLENSGLYWHLVDIIWIFLFPLFYLIL